MEGWHLVRSGHLPISKATREEGSSRPLLYMGSLTPQCPGGQGRPETPWVLRPGSRGSDLSRTQHSEATCLP